MITFENAEIRVKFWFNVARENEIIEACYEIRDKETGKRNKIVGIAKRHPKDSPNEVIGKAVALCKANLMLKNNVSDDEFMSINIMILSHYKRVSKVLAQVVEDSKNIELEYVTFVI